MRGTTRRTLGTVLLAVGCMGVFLGIMGFILSRTDSPQVQSIVASFSEPSTHFGARIIATVMNGAIAHAGLVILAGLLPLTVGLLLLMGPGASASASSTGRTQAASKASRSNASQTPNWDWQLPGTEVAPFPTAAQPKNPTAVESAKAAPSLESLLTPKVATPNTVAPKTMEGKFQPMLPRNEASETVVSETSSATPPRREEETELHRVSVTRPATPRIRTTMGRHHP